MEAHGQARVRLALEAYTFGHFPIVAGIVLAALGVEGVLAHADEAEPSALFGGVALYLAGVVILAVLVIFETTRYAQTRRSLRDA